MSREYQGWLGIDLLVDLRTAEASAELAARFSAGQDFWFKAHGAVLPVTPARAHVTLFQCQGARVGPEESWNTLEVVLIGSLKFIRQSLFFAFNRNPVNQIESHNKNNCNHWMPNNETKS